MIGYGGNFTSVNPPVMSWVGDLWVPLKGYRDMWSGPIPAAWTTYFQQAMAGTPGKDSAELGLPARPGAAGPERDVRRR